MEFTIPNINMAAISPMLALVITAVLLILLTLFFHTIRREVLAVIAIAGLVVSGFGLIRLWKSPQTGFDQMLMMDHLAVAVHLTLLLAAGLAILISLNRVEEEYLPYGEFFGLLLFAVIGMMVLTSTWNLLVMFLGLEVFSLALYVLAGIRKMRVDSVEASLKYFLLGAFAGGFLLYGMALLYGVTGTLSMTEMMNSIQADARTPLLFYAGILLIFIGLAFKAALVPFHMWIPDVYQGAATPVTAFMSTATKAAATIVLLRLVNISMAVVDFPWSKILVVMAVLTMSIGNLLAISQNNVKRMLAYSSISHAGYLLVGLLAFNQIGVVAILFYLFVYTAMNLGAFGVISFMGDSNQNERIDFESYRGLGYRYPFVSFCLAVFMFGLAGIPPTGGFVGKLYLFSAATNQGYLGLVIVAVLNSVVSVYYYLRLVINLYMKESEQTIIIEKAHPGLLLALLISVLVVLQTGFYPALLTNWLHGAIRLWP